MKLCLLNKKERELKLSKDLKKERQNKSSN